jgi:hypothetical protein
LSNGGGLFRWSLTVDILDSRVFINCCAYARPLGAWLAGGGLSVGASWL